MKKIIISIIFILITITSSAQVLFNIHNNSNVEFSMGVTNFVPNTTFVDRPFESEFKNNLTLSFDISVMGVYFSFNYSSVLNKEYRNYIDEEIKTRIFHFGYKIPILPFLYVYPMFGRVKMVTGYYNDISKAQRFNWNRDPNFITTDILVNEYDYGLGVDVKLGKYFIISAKLTKYTYGASIGAVFEF